MDIINQICGVGKNMLRRKKAKIKIIIFLDAIYYIVSIDQIIISVIKGFMNE